MVIRASTRKTQLHVDSELADTTRTVGTELTSIVLCDRASATPTTGPYVRLKATSGTPERHHTQLKMLSAQNKKDRRRCVQVLLEE
ncbi:hypothetical protein N9L06_06310 [Mariniblastus sp.]|nr:hypothetical protein [Mariniblastus sp.]